MKKVAVVLMCIMCFKNAIAQLDTLNLKPNKNWTIGLILLNETELNYAYQLNPHYLPGLVVKRHFKHLNIRAAGEYTETFFTSGATMCCDMAQRDGFMKSALVRVGVEKGIKLGNFFRPYAAMDFTGIFDYGISRFTVGFFPMDAIEKRQSFSLGFLPTLGFDLGFTKSVYFGFECRLRNLYTNSLVLRTDNIRANSQGSTHNTFFNSDIDRIGAISLNVRF